MLLGSYASYRFDGSPIALSAHEVKAFLHDRFDETVNADYDCHWRAIEGPDGWALMDEEGYMMDDGMDWVLDPLTPYQAMVMAIIY
jgi:hypothetical protein